MVETWKEVDSRGLSWMEHGDLKHSRLELQLKMRGSL